MKLSSLPHNPDCMGTLGQCAAPLFGQYWPCFWAILALLLLAYADRTPVVQLPLPTCGFALMVARVCCYCDEQQAHFVATPATHCAQPACTTSGKSPLWWFAAPCLCLAGWLRCRLQSYPVHAALSAQSLCEDFKSRLGWALLPWLGGIDYDLSLVPWCSMVHGAHP